jgi:hypothetical protein
VTVTPATVIVALRAAPVFAFAPKPTVPLPLPQLPEVTVNQLLAVVAVHEQPVAAVTATLDVPPEPGKEAVVGVTEGLHDDVPFCVTVNVCPAMVAVPVRFAVPVCAATE